MDAAQEKALWDFAVKEAAWIDAEAGTSARQARLDLNDAARALLSVLAEEAPPAKEPWKAEQARQMYNTHQAAPKQERGVEEMLAELLLMWAGTQRTTALLRNIQALYREERAASELTEKAYQQVCRANVSAHEMIEELRAENASLRERIARATAWRRKFGPPDDTDIRILEGREGKGKGTEATK